MFRSCFDHVLVFFLLFGWCPGNGAVTSLSCLGRLGVVVVVVSGLSRWCLGLVLVLLFRMAR